MPGPFHSAPIGASAGSQGSSLSLARGRSHLRVRTAVAATALAAAGSAACVRYQQRQPSPGVQTPFKVPRPLVEGFCGAVGEIASVAILYPLDSIKVRCQATNSTVARVLVDMLRGSSRMAVAKQLYAGVVSASLCSVAVGSLYYFSFCASKRFANDLVLSGEKQYGRWVAAAAAAEASVAQPQLQVCTAPAAATAAGDATPQQHLPATATGSIDWHHDVVLLSLSYEQRKAAVAAAAAATTPPVCTKTEPDHKMVANIIAACTAAVVGALVEAPVELFKHQTQAGLLRGSMIGNMGKALRRSGPAALYWGFLPFCFKSLPFDIGELTTYSQLQDVRTQSQKRRQAAAATDAAATSSSGSSSSTSNKPGVLAAVPDHVWDMAIGACAGMAAVMISHPSDCIKTVMETSGLDMAGKGVLGCASAFVGTGRRIVAKQGARGLFVGLSPRLAGEVPSTMFYWLAVEGCRRLLQPYTA